MCFVFGAFLAFGGIFGNAQLQVLWGYLLAFAAPLLIAALCMGAIHGSAVLWAVASVAAASIGGYFLLLDTDVKIYRGSIKRRHDV